MGSKYFLIRIDSGEWKKNKVDKILCVCISTYNSATCPNQWYNILVLLLMWPKFTTQHNLRTLWSTFTFCWLRLHTTDLHLSYSIHWFHPPLFTHRGRMTYICTHQPGHSCFRQWLVACLVPCHFLNQCWLIVNWTKKLLTKMQQFPHKKISFHIPCTNCWPFLLSLDVLVYFQIYLYQNQNTEKWAGTTAAGIKSDSVFTLGGHLHRKGTVVIPCVRLSVLNEVTTGTL